MDSYFEDDYRGRIDKKREYDRINLELKDIAWKLYDLTCDFKDLRYDACQLVETGHYDRYEKHNRSSYKESTSSQKSRKTTKDSKRSSWREKSDESADQEKFEKCKQKYLEDFEKALEYRRNRCMKKTEEELERSMSKHRYSSPSLTPSAKYASTYEGLSTEELEQRLREKLDVLQRKAMHLKESYCGRERSYSTNSYEGDKKTNVSCMRKMKERNLHSPHRVYLDGESTYVVDHADSKVIFVPKTYEY
uniref:Uncharacterized protein n=1 Tax=Clytia hemisphaerica TaxID=252671 RepID=A0A7M5XKL8_9CNID